MIPFAVVAVGVLLAVLAWWCIVRQARGEGRPLLEDLRDWMEELAKDIDEHEMELTGWNPPSVPLMEPDKEPHGHYVTTDEFMPVFFCRDYAQRVHNIQVESTPLLPFDNLYYFWPTDVPPVAPTKLDPVTE